MQASDIPVKFRVPFAASAGGGYSTTPIPYAPGSPGRASLQEGFPPSTFTQVASGGNPPWGADMNGLMYQTTAWIQWATAGGLPTVYDATFSSQVGGYPQGAMLRASAVSDSIGQQYWISAVDNNTSNPDTGGANWIAFPGRNVQLQKSNYAADTGAANAVVITLSPVPTSWSQIVGAPVRFKIAFTNTVTNPTININGIGAKTMINADGSAMGVGQLVAGRIVEGIPCDDDKFQVNSPVKATAASSFPIPGMMILWPRNTPPTGFLECAGQTLLIASYPNLYAVLGTYYGGDGANNFKLPDYRGQFIRGWDHGRGLDPNAAQRSNAGGGTSGDNVGTTQGFAAGPISLTGAALTIFNPVAKSSLRPEGPVVNGQDPNGTFANMYRLNWLGPDATGDAISYLAGSANLSGTSGANETRPVNIYAMVCIAY